MGVQWDLPRPMGKPIGEITHWRNKNVEDLPRQLEYTNPCPWRDPYKGIHKGGRPKAASFIWVPPWVQVRVFGLSGQVLHIFITVMCDFAYGFPHGYTPDIIELPLGTILALREQACNYQRRQLVN